VLSLRIGGAVHPLPLYAFMVCIETNLYLIHFTVLGVAPENLVSVDFEKQNTAKIPKLQ
jgi:hypothetical protein